MEKCETIDKDELDRANSRILQMEEYLHLQRLAFAQSQRTAIIVDLEEVRFGIWREDISNSFLIECILYTEKIEPTFIQKLFSSNIRSGRFFTKLLLEAKNHGEHRYVIPIKNLVETLGNINLCSELHQCFIKIFE